MILRIHADTRSHIELLGEGDVIGPWVGSGQELTLPSVPTRRSVQGAGRAARPAVRDQDGPWPEIHAALMQRLIVRAAGEAFSRRSTRCRGSRSGSR